MPVGGLGIGRKPDEPEVDPSAETDALPEEFEDIRLVRVLTNEVGLPTFDPTGARGVYTVVFQLSDEPSPRWSDFLIRFWDRPQVAVPQGRHRPGTASVVSNRLNLEGTTIDEVEGYLLPVLKAALRMANDAERRALAEDHRRAEQRRHEEALHRRHVQEVADRLPLE